MTVTCVVHRELPELPPGITVAVGFFPGAKYETGAPVAGVAAVHEFGIGVPARPFMRPTIAANATGRWSQAIAQSLQGGKTLDQVAHVFGNFARGDIQEAIARLTSPPLSEATLYARRHRATPNQSTKPLVDTRIMLPSVQYEVSK